MSRTDAARTMSFWEHLAELRLRLAICLGAVAAAAIVGYVFREPLYRMLLFPLQRAVPGITLNYFAPQETFLVFLRIAVFAGLVLASPVVFWQAWAFVAPALKPQERRLVLPVLPVVLALFALGVLFVYFVLLPLSLGFLLGLAPAQLEPELHQERYFGFVTALCLAGGVVFELPVVLGLLGYLGLVNAAWLWRRTHYALLVLMIVAAIITPTGDAFNMLVLTAPMLLLYLLSILVVLVIERARRVKAPPHRV